MCGIAGIVTYEKDLLKTPESIERRIQKMNQVQKHRGPDEEGVYLSKHCALGHVRLKVIDLETGNQPMGFGSNVIVYNGEIYNMMELKQELIRLGAEFETKSDTEVLLQGYAYFGISFLEKCNGVFSFALWDHQKMTLYLVRDPAGVKPLFYQKHKDEILFSSEPKGILQQLSQKPKLTTETLCEVFGLGPAKTYGLGPFSNMKEVRPGCYVKITNNSIEEVSYESLKAGEHWESYENTVEHVRYLVMDSVKLQMLSDVPICTFLSGGLDSSLVTSLIQGEKKKKGEILDTYSFDFVDNDINFKGSAFQPSEDRNFVSCMQKYLGTHHEILMCGAKDLYDNLLEAVDARDYPCMADVESSLLFFCKKVSKKHKVALTGECADEIFGGYPWYYKKELMEQNMFPWTTDWTARVSLLKKDVLERLPLKEYAYAAYETTIEEAPVLPGESKEVRRMRQMQYLNLRWFMQTLLDRMDRTSMKCGLEARVPFADKRIIAYLYNVPWEMKAHNGVIKGLLRDAFVDYLPKEIYERKKSPYPKTYDPVYEKLVKQKILEVLKDSNAPIREYLDEEKVKDFCKGGADYGRPFYGQLMAGPQLIAYYLQLNYWLEKYF